MEKHPKRAKDGKSPSPSAAVMVPVDLSRHYNWPPDGRARGAPPAFWRQLREKVSAFPKGTQTAWGIPFSLGKGKCPQVILLTDKDDAVTVPVNGRATYICVLHLYEQLPEEVDRDDSIVKRDKPVEGSTVAEYQLEYQDGNRCSLPVRGRYEVAVAESPGPPWLAQPFDGFQVVDPAKPREDCPWGFAQYGLYMGHRFQPRMPYVCAMVNPHPEKTLCGVSFQGLTPSPILVAAVTLYAGSAHPLAYLPRRAYRITAGGSPVRMQDPEIDLGVIARIEQTREPRGKRWLAKADLPEPCLNGSPSGQGESPSKGSGSAPGEGESLLHITAARDATLRVTLEQEGRKTQHSFSLAEAYRKRTSRSGGPALEVLGRKRQWMRVRIIDGTTGRPTPARVHFSGSRGEYIAPYGHHEQINTNWLEDYGADLAWNGRNYAYVPGEFTTDMPIGDVYAEIVKGFEYSPVRHKVKIAPGQASLDLTIHRWADLRHSGWVTADTHVHFISPQTAWLEGQAEGVNIVNLLASQWGRLFTNVGDISGRVGVVEDDTIVYVGTENRNHMLGHMSMLGTQGLPVYPMCGGGPSESWVGDPDFASLIDWARENRQRGGLVIRPHFPWVGFTEDPVPIIQGLVDALEIGIGPASVLKFATQEWYRYLNCGYRVAVVGGTDKMSARQALGAIRTYAYVGTEDDLSYEVWQNAVRAGRTFSTSGPLIDLSVDGRTIGDTIAMPAGGGTVEVSSRAEAFHPIHSLEIIYNGEVVASAVASTTARRGERSLAISERLTLPGSGWIAARCSGPSSRPIPQNAHTSPIYVNCGDERIFHGPAAEHMLALVDGGIEYLNTIATCFDEASRRRMVKQFREVQRELRFRLSAADHPHPH